jgi:hypothetical protein
MNLPVIIAEPSVLSLFLLLPFLLIGILGTVFWIWMLIDCATKESSQGNDKIVWIIVIALTHLIGAAIYFLVRRPTRMRELGV